MGGVVRALRRSLPSTAFHEFWPVPGESTEALCPPKQAWEAPPVTKLPTIGGPKTPPRDQLGGRRRPRAALQLAGQHQLEVNLPRSQQCSRLVSSASLRRSRREKHDTSRMGCSSASRSLQFEEADDSAVPLYPATALPQPQERCSSVPVTGTAKSDNDLAARTKKAKAVLALQRLFFEELEQNK